MRPAIAFVSFLLMFATQERVPEKAARIDGIVVNGVSGEGIAGARLMLRPEGPRPRPFATTSGTDGHFILKDLPAGRYRLSATRQGYIGQPTGQRWLEDSSILVDLTNGQQVQEI